MANEPPDFQELPVTIISPPLGDTLKPIGWSLLCVSIGMLLISDPPGWWANIAGGFLLCLGIFLLWRSLFGATKIKFNDKRVRVTSRLWLKKLVWEEPLSAFEGVRLDHTDYAGEYPDTYYVKLVHPDNEKTLILHETQGPDRLWSWRWHDGGPAAFTFLNKVGEVLNIPVLEVEDEE